MSEDTTAILQLMATKGIGPRKLGRLLADLSEEGKTAGDVVRPPDTEWLVRHGLSSREAGGVATARPQAELWSKDLHTHGVRVFAKGTAQDPERILCSLGEQVPPVLFVRGEPSLFARKAVSFHGSRQASNIGLSLTRACAEELARARAHIISGYANGVDLAAHAAALSAGGVTTLVLAEGILRFRLKPELAELWDEERAVVVSEFQPRAIWSVGNAMQRNRTILGLADVAVVIESGPSGGTFAAAELALKRKLPLFVVNYRSPPPSAEGNKHLLDRGATPLRLASDGYPQVEAIIDALDRSAHDRPNFTGVHETSHLPTSTSTRRLKQGSLFDSSAD
jgi:DNA processing protein